MKNNAYFDNAATTWPKPEPVYQFMDSFFRSHGVNPGRSGSLLALEAEQMITATRSMLARFFGFSGPSSRVVFTLNGTDALNQSIAGLLKPGDHVIITRLEHNAVLRVINHMERDQQLQVTRIGCDASGYINAEDIQLALRPNTRAIVLNHASNVFGTVQPLDAVAQIARQAEVALIVDAAQTAGVIPIDMDALGISVLTFPGHKGLFGPMGIGGMIVAESLDLTPQRFGGTGVNSLSTYQPDAYPYRLEAGTVSLPGIAGLHAAQLWFRELGEQLQRCPPGAEGYGFGGALSVSEGVSSARVSRLGASTLEEAHFAVQADEDVSAVGDSTISDHAALCRLAIQHIHQCELTHLQRIEALLQEFETVRILARARPDARVATLSFTVDGMLTEQIADQLDADHQICARAGLHCAPLVHIDANTVDVGGAIRLSPGYFTDEEDMQQLLHALGDILA